MSIATTLGNLTRQWRQRRAVARTERVIGGMPFEIRKDIGWPDRYTAELGRHPARDHLGR